MTALIDREVTVSPHDDDVPLRYVMERVREVQDAISAVSQKIDDRMGEHAVRLARMELRQDLTDRRLETDTGGRRFVLTTVISTVAVLVSIAALVMTMMLKG